jgi:hypothetical protein
LEKLIISWLNRDSYPSNYPEILWFGKVMMIHSTEIKWISKCTVGFLRSSKRPRFCFANNGDDVAGNSRSACFWGHRRHLLVSEGVQLDRLISIRSPLSRRREESLFNIGDRF